MKRRRFLLIVLCSFPLWVTAQNITFADTTVKSLCLQNWDKNKDGEISELEATLVTSIGTVFKEKNIASFDELQYFTKLTNIGDSAFYGCSGLTSISIPEGVESIDNSAFQNCRSLTNITLPKGLNSIGNDAFRDCRILADIAIPEAVINIGEYAFRNCRGFTSITIPAGVISIGNGAFVECSGLTSIVVDEDNVAYTSANGANAIIEKATNTLLVGCINTVIPTNVKSIGDRAFMSCSDLTGIGIPEGVTNIGLVAFQNCSSLRLISIPSSVTSIGARAFADCPNIRVFDVATDNTIYTSSNGANAIIEKATNKLISGCQNTKIPSSVTCIGESAFSGCSKLIGINIPMSVTCIGDSAFFNCYNLMSFTIPMGIKSIGNRAFYGCRNMARINIPTSVTIIGNYAFENCFALTNITIPASINIFGNGAFKGCSHLTSVTIQEGITNISNDAFYNCRGLKNINIPNGVTCIGNSAFQDCRSLTNITLPEGLNSIGNDAFRDCRILTNTAIPAAVINIGEYAFRNCRSFTSITIPAGVISIGNGAFVECSSLTSIVVDEDNVAYTSANGANAIIEKATNTLLVGCINTVIPTNVKSIGDRAFMSCTGLTSIDIPEGVTNIGLVAFQYSSGLINISIPSSVTSIGARAFADCTSLKEMKVGIKTPLEITNETFSDCYCANAILYVPKGSKSAYEAAEYWKDFGEIIESDHILSKDESIAVVGVTTRFGWNVELNIELINKSTDLTAYQFDLMLPSGISIAKNAKGRYIVSTTDRYEDNNPILSVTQLANGSYRILCYSASNGLITGNDGPIINMMLTMDTSVSPNFYEASVFDAVATRTDKSQVWMRDVTFNIIVTPVPKGDTNNDDVINVADIVEIVNYICEKTSTRFVKDAADMNNDGIVNVTDIVYIVDIIMAPEASRTSEHAQWTSTANDQLALTGAVGQPFGLWLTNEAAYVASQFDIRLSAGQTLEGVALNDSRADGHLLTCEEIADGLYRVVVCSLTGNAYRGDSGELLTISVKGQGEVAVEKIMFVTADAAEKRFADLHSGTTAISTARQLAAPADVYTTDGRMVRSQATSLDGLKKGVYIVNGRKEVVR